MLRLHGRRRSNYFNAVKAILIEKGLEYEEVIEPVPPTDAFLQLSPMAKIPCLVTEDGPLTETMTIIHYLESLYPQPPLAPADAYQRAKLDEVGKVLELYIEWAARRGFGVLRGETVSEETQAGVKAALSQAAPAVAALTDFDPWIGGPEFTWADIFGYFMFIYAIPAAKANAEMDLLTAIPGASDWYARVGERASVSRVLAEAKEG